MDNMEIEAIDTYDFRRARLSLALRWIVQAAFGASVPPELREPLPLKEKDTLSAIYLNTGLVNLLVNAKLYLQACGRLFPDHGWKGGHWAIIQGLSREGFYVEDDSGQAITEHELMQTSPFQLVAHVALIEALMNAFTKATVTTDKVVQAVSAVGPFRASHDLPIDSEDALLLWLNKVSTASVQRSAERLKQSHSSTVSIKVKHLAEVTPCNADPMDDLLKDISEGGHLALLISFYCPEQLAFSDIHLRKPIGIGDSLYNLALIKRFCDGHLPMKIYHFTSEDLLYSNHTLKPSLLVFLAHLFSYFVLNPLDIVQRHCSAAGESARTPLVSRPVLPSTSKMVRDAGPVDLISNATKQSFQKPLDHLSSSDLYGSNPSLSSSPTGLQHKLLPKRSSAIDELSRQGVMHDVLSPIAVRKSRSMASLTAPDPNQSLVAWENKAYYVDRMKNGHHLEPQNNMTSANTASENEHDSSTDQSIDLSEPSPVVTRNHIRQQPKQADSLLSRSKHAEPSNSYQKLLERSNDLNTPLRQFAMKHGFTLDLSKATPQQILKEEQQTSPSDIAASRSDFTSVTPRDDTSMGGVTEPVSVGQSYVIRTSSQDCAVAAGLPVLSTSVCDSCTDVTFTSIMETNGNHEKEAADSPIPPIYMDVCTESNSQSGDDQVLSNGHHERTNSVTSFAAAHMEKMQRDALKQSLDADGVPFTSLKEQFIKQRSEGGDAKPVKKTTFSLNETTWQDHAMANSRDADSDTTSESSETSVDRKQLVDVKLLLEEKRKAIEKKKNICDMERRGELDNCSRDAFLKAVSKHKQDKKNPPQQNTAVTAFSRNDIAKSIENLQTKWQQDDEINAKRAAAVNPSKRMNRALSLDKLDKISEVVDMEKDSGSTKISTATSDKQPLTMTTGESLNLLPSVHEEPLDLQQFGLVKLNESINELKGHMQKLTAEQQRIEELQRAVIQKEAADAAALVRRQAQSEQITEPKSYHSKERKKQTDSDSSAPDHDNVNILYSQNAPVDNHLTNTQSRLRSPVESVEKSKNGLDSWPGGQVDKRTDRNYAIQDVHQSASPMKASVSPDRPFVLHSSPSSKKKVADKTQNASEPRGAKKGSTASSPSPKPTGFLSSSQLSKTKVDSPMASVTSSPNLSQSMTSSLDSSNGRKRWSMSAVPLFPGYDDTPARLPTGLIGEVGLPPNQSQTVEDTPLKSRNTQLTKKAPLSDCSSTSLPPNNPDHIFKQPDLGAVGVEHSFNTPKRSLSSHLPQQSMADGELDTPLKGFSHTANPKQYSTDLQETPERDIGLISDSAPIQSNVLTSTVHNNRTYSFPDREVSLDTPLRVASALPVREFASSRHGTTLLGSPSTSRHGVMSLNYDNPNHMIAHVLNTPDMMHSAGYAEYPAVDTPAQSSSARGYKLNAPYGTAENELTPQSGISLSTAMDSLRTDMLKYTLDARKAPESTWHSSGVASSPSHVMERVPSFGSSDALLSTTSYDSREPNFYVASGDRSSINSKPASLVDNDDQISVGSGSVGSGGDVTPGRPKRATWDMTTPKGDILNATVGSDKAGVGFVIAATEQLSEDELQRRKEKVLMMQMRRREETERKKLEKEAEAAAKREDLRQKESEVERKKMEEKMKKEAILQEYQMKKAEEDLPPHLRVQFRQKLSNRKSEKFNSWSPGAFEDVSFSNDPVDSSSMFSSVSGNLTHRRPSSPAGAGSSTNRSKAPSRGPVDVPPAEYSGPKLYVQPSNKAKSNRTIVINAVSHCCLAGTVNTDFKNKVLEEVAKSDGKHFLILFRDGNQTYKGLYSFCPDSEECTRIHGQGPKNIVNDMCHRFYKYNSGGKKFTEVTSTKHLSVSIDAITIQNHFWSKKTLIKK